MMVWARKKFLGVSLRTVALILLAIIVAIAVDVLSRGAGRRSVNDDRFQAHASHVTLQDFRQELLVPALFLAGFAVLFVLVKLPQLQVSHSKGLTDENRFDRENEARKTLAQILAGAFVLAGLYSSMQTLDLARNGQLTDRFSKAVEQLGSDKLDVRLGGIYALERIAHDSEKDHTAINEILTAFVREHSHRKNSGPEATDEALPLEAPRQPADVQAILDVLGRRETLYDNEPLNLDFTDLRYVNVFGDFRGVVLGGADLRWAQLNGANLGGAYLLDANLGGAGLVATDLRDVNFGGADLGGVNLQFANVRGADLSGAKNLTQKQINSAEGDKDTKLPSSFTRPASWK